MPHPKGVPDDPGALRDQRKTKVLKSLEKLHALELARDQALGERDEALIEAHGPRGEGGLSYNELVGLTDPSKNGRRATTKLSRQRIIQVVQAGRGD